MKPYHDGTVGAGSIAVDIESAALDRIGVVIMTIWNISLNAAPGHSRTGGRQKCDRQEK